MKIISTLILGFLFLTSLFSQPFTSSNLPIVLISTDINPGTGNPAEITDEPKVGGKIKIIYRPDGSRNYLTDQNNPAFINYQGRIGIELRGSSSQDLPKKSYGLTSMKGDNSTDTNVSIFNMPAEHDWILNSLAFDPSLLRDYLSYELYREMGNYSVRQRYCEVMINNVYKGLYIFTEKIKADDGRVNIVKMLSTDNTVPLVTGGYITKCDKIKAGDVTAWTMPQTGGGTVRYIHDYPNSDFITASQHNYIYGQFINLENVVSAQNSSILNGYPSIIDVPSFVDFMIMAELSSNPDSYQYSTFFHKDRNGKLRAGPIWDFNLTYGNDLFIYGFDRSHTDVWQFNYAGNNGSTFWKGLFDNSTFKCYLTKRWLELTAPGKPLNNTNVNQKIDQIVALISEAANREETLWGTVGNLSGNIMSMKNWLTQRYSWINSKLNDYSACSNPNLPKLVISQINYHPLPTAGYTDEQLEFIEITNNSSASVNLTGIYFKELGLTYQFPANSSLNAQQKIYLCGNSAVFQQNYGLSAFGEFTRDLSNKSEKLVLCDAFGNIIDFVEYQDTIPWPQAADGAGAYLQLIDVNLDNSLASSWTASWFSGINPLLNDNNEIFIYPNPASDAASINNLSSDYLGGCYKVITTDGNVVYAKNINASTETLETRYLPAGLYFINIFNSAMTKSCNLRLSVIR